jgi:hypothetical protein
VPAEHLQGSAHPICAEGMPALPENCLHATDMRIAHLRHKLRLELSRRLWVLVPATPENPPGSSHTSGRDFLCNLKSPPVKRRVYQSIVSQLKERAMQPLFGLQRSM